MLGVINYISSKTKDMDKTKFDPICIRLLQVEDISGEYIKWYSNKEVVRYSDNQYRFFSIEAQIDYVKTCLDNKDLDLYGIFFNSQHIGNITISGLTSEHKRAEIAYVIGDSDYWGKGYDGNYWSK